MNRTEWIALIVLVAALMLWGPIFQLINPPPPIDPTQELEPVSTEETYSGQGLPTREVAISSPQDSVDKDALSLAEASSEPETIRQAEETMILENDLVRLTFSSYGATIRSAVMKAYPQSLDLDSPPVVLDFKDVKSLAYTGIENLPSYGDFKLERGSGSFAVVGTRKLTPTLELRRTVELVDHYLVQVEDVFANRGTEDAALGEHGLQMGFMQNLASDRMQKGVVSLGVDTLLVGGEGVKYWGKKVPGWLKHDTDGSIAQPFNNPIDWIAVKNTYFTQILTPIGGADDFTVYARAEPGRKKVDEVAASASFPAQIIPAGETFVRNSRLYIGPKKYSELNKYGLHQVDVMEFGMWRAVGKVLLVIMNWFQSTLWPHNYGVAIMLLTIIVRILFWPLTHKSTESMKRMAELQPQMMEIKEKYKDNAQKQQQSIMALYKENKVNPLGGCLPVLVQIPVFIALFVVLRSAIELRFAEFLWIKDLSQPENLFADILPIPLNILPIFMAVTMVLQQKLSPQTGDARQQKMMMTIMPVFMLFIFYNFASGLVVYWTTNQCLMIVQLYFQKRSREKKMGGD